MGESICISRCVRRAAEHVEVPCVYFLMTTLLQYAAPSTDAQGSWVRRSAEHVDAQECCAFGRAGLLSIWTRRAAEHLDTQGC